MKTVIVDADGLIALFSKGDAHAEKTIASLQKLVQEEAKILYPATAIAEATTTLQRKLNKPHLAAQIAELIKENKFPIEPVNEDTLNTAVQYFKPVESSKHNTLFDALVAAIAKENNADAIFSFDACYQKQGFTLVTSLT
jgi:predicted nucleic acid-binding protein